MAPQPMLVRPTGSAPIIKRKVVMLPLLHQRMTIFASDDSQSGVSLDESDDSSMSADDWSYEDEIISGRTCLCGAGGRAHKKDCPMSSRNR